MTQSSEPVNRKALFLRACRCEPVERVPVWIMRQAGRYLPEYRAVRAETQFSGSLQDAGTGHRGFAAALSHPGRGCRHRFLRYFDSCRSDGRCHSNYRTRGPVIESPLRTAAQVGELSSFDPERETRLPDGRDSRPRPGAGTRRAGAGLCRRAVDAGMLHDRGPRQRWIPRREDDALLRSANCFEACSNASRTPRRGICERRSRRARQRCNCSTPGWANLTLDQYREFALPATQLLIEEIGAGDTPVILYTKASSHLLTAAAESGANVLSVDWRVDLATRARIGRAAHRAARQRRSVRACSARKKACARAAREAVESTGRHRPHPEPGPRHPAADAGGKCARVCRSAGQSAPSPSSRRMKVRARKAGRR